MLPERRRRNKIFRALAVFWIAVMLATLTSMVLFVFEKNSLTPWNILLFIISYAGCFYFLFMTYYVKAQRERASTLSEERYQSIIAAAGMGVWEFHAETGYVWCSTEYFQMLGYDQEGFLQQYALNIDDVWTNRLHPEDRQKAVDKFNAYLSSENNAMYEHTFRLRHKSGKWVWVLSRSKTLQNGNNPAKKVLLGTHIDITDKITIQLELHKRNQKLMDFSFSNAHHVRGSVARMLGLAQLVKLDAEGDREWYVEKISSEVQQLDEIIRSISRELDEINELP